MIEITPNRYPIFVYFAIDLFSTAVGFSLLYYIIDRIKVVPLGVTVELEMILG